MALNIAFTEKEWIPALRSKRYQQGEGRLCTEEDGEKKFCCLGVACDLLKDRFGYRWVQQDGFVRLIGEHDNVGASLPAEIATFIGISDNGECKSDPALPYGRSGGESTSLAILNDFSHYDFDQIAAYLEAAVASAKQGIESFAPTYTRGGVSNAPDAEDAV